MELNMKKIDTGMSESELLKLCDEKYTGKGVVTWHYWTAEVYSFGKHIRNYAFYPYILPLFVYTDHGVGSYTNEIPKHELEHKAYCQLYHSSVSAELFNDKDELVDSFVVTPESDVNNKQINAIVIIPKKIMNPSSKYTVSVKVKLANKPDEQIFKYSFETKSE